MSPADIVDTISFGTPTGNARIAAVAIAVFPDPPAPSTPSIAPAAWRRLASLAAPSAIARTAPPRSPASCALISSRAMSGFTVGGPPVPTSASSTSTPAWRSRERRKASSSPFVSRVPISKTATGR